MRYKLVIDVTDDPSSPPSVIDYIRKNLGAESFDIRPSPNEGVVEATLYFNEYDKAVEASRLHWANDRGTLDQLPIPVFDEGPTEWKPIRPENFISVLSAVLRNGDEMGRSPKLISSDGGFIVIAEADTFGQAPKVTNEQVVLRAVDIGKADLHLLSSTRYEPVI